jgi:demethylmenaquinone methyltransferase/2-methoxy-6-polyprenyl-1,4-benzoquinol methylase
MSHHTDPIETRDVVDDMRAYYARRAAYYERVYFKPERQADLRAMEAWLPTAFAGRHVLEVACGTGWWTPHGARDAASWLATDINPETMAVARSKRLPGCVAFATVDAYTLAGLQGQAVGDAASQGATSFDAAASRGATSFDAAASRGATSFDAAASPGATSFDAAFAGCWWSHVPLQRMGDWLDTLHAHLAPGARVVMLDNSYVQTSSMPISRRDAHGNTYQNRTLDDGSVHEVLKNFPCADEATALLGTRARGVVWTAYTHYWVLSYQCA